MKSRKLAVVLVLGDLLLLITVLGFAGCSKAMIRREAGKPSSSRRLPGEPVHAGTPRRGPTAGMRTRGAPLLRTSSWVKGALSRGKQTATWKRSVVRPNTSRLMIGDKEELPLKAMQVTVRVDGFRARVLLDCYFYNNRRRQYEGTFKLRLPEGASPYFLAFGSTSYRASDVAAGKAGVLGEELARKGTGFRPREIMYQRRESWNRPKEARMVPRQKAAFAYRSTVHQRVDPALMEWSGAGIFSARVFPIFPRKVHRIVIGYDVDLIAAGKDLEYKLDLPGKVPNCVVDLSVAAPRGDSVTVKPEMSPFVWLGRSHFRFANPKCRTITVRLAKPGATLLTGSDPKTGGYFAAAFRPELPAGERAGSPDRAIFMVDTSLSSNPDKFNVYLKLLESILGRNRDSVKSFAVLFFDVSQHWWRSGWTTNTPANTEALLAHAGGLSLEGATDMRAALRAAARPKWLTGKGADVNRDTFLLSDGAATWGQDDLYALSGALGTKSPGALFAYRTGMAGTDRRALDHLARATGGAVFSVVGEDEVTRAARAHRSRPWRIENITVAGGSDLLLAGRPKSVFPGQRLVLVGRGTPDAGAECVLTLSRDKVRRTVRTRFARRTASDLAPRTYGQVAVGQLEDLGAASEGASKAYACHFRVTGRTCSLLMLEGEWQYRRFNIKPAEGAALVKSTPAGRLLDRLLAGAAAEIGNPKAAFLAALGKLEKSAGVGFKTPPELRKALEAMPRESFVVETEPLACGAVPKSSLPSRFASMLAGGKVDYDRTSAEAQRRLRTSGAADALRALSSLVEHSPGDGVLVRDVGFTAMSWGFGGHAYHLFRKRAAARPDNPQNYRAMALCLSGLGRADLAMACFEVALNGNWNPRFGNFREILALDYLHLLRGITKGKLKTSAPAFAAARLAALGDRFGIGKADLVVSISWNTDATDVDLHVTEPGGQTCSYRRPRTRIGGAITRDVTTGYGPEMYVIKRARAGSYRIRSYYYAANRNRASVRTKVYATIITGWGTENERVTRRVVSLARSRRFHKIATVVVGG